MLQSGVAVYGSSPVLPSGVTVRCYLQAENDFPMARQQCDQLQAKVDQVITDALGPNGGALSISDMAR